MGAAELNHAKKNYYSILADEEIPCVGAGIGGGFSNTNELKVMKYKEAMASPEAKGWKEAIVWHQMADYPHPTCLGRQGRRTDHRSDIAEMRGVDNRFLNQYAQPGDAGSVLI